MNFYYPSIPESFGAIVEHLKETPSRLHELVSNLPAEVLVHKPNDKWSIQEHIGHLLCIESLWIARLDDLVLGHESVRPWNGTNADTDAARFNEQNIISILRDFRNIREMHTTMLSEMEEKAEILVANHPGNNKKLRLVDHVWMMLNHDQHHLEILQRRKADYR
ncbi:MAG: DinB family protein [Flavobacteriales bacterium]